MGLAECDKMGGEVARRRHANAAKLLRAGRKGAGSNQTQMMGAHRKNMITKTRCSTRPTSLKFFAPRACVEIVSIPVEKPTPIETPVTFAVHRMEHSYADPERDSGLKGAPNIKANASASSSTLPKCPTCATTPPRNKMASPQRHDGDVPWRM